MSIIGKTDSPEYCFDKYIKPITSDYSSSSSPSSCSSSSSSSSSSSASTAGSEVSGSIVSAKCKKKVPEDPILKQAEWLLKQIPFFEDADWLEEGIKRLSKFNLRITLGEEFPTMPNEPKEGLMIEDRVYVHLFSILSAENPEVVKKGSLMTIDPAWMRQATVQQRKEALTRVCIEVAIYGLSQIMKNDHPRKNNEIEGLRITLPDYLAEKEMEQQKKLAKMAYIIFFNSFFVSKKEFLQSLDEFYAYGCENAAADTRQLEMYAQRSTEYLGLSHMANALGLIWKTPNWQVGIS